MRIRFAILEKIAIGLVMPWLGWSCASAPVAWEVPIDHPASPQAESAPYAAPTSPFAEAVEEMATPAEGEPVMDHSTMDHSAHGGHEQSEPPKDPPPEGRQP